MNEQIILKCIESIAKNDLDNMFIACDRMQVKKHKRKNYPFTLPAVNPCTKNFWQNMKISTTGMSVSTDMANT